MTGSATSSGVWTLLANCKQVKSCWDGSQTMTNLAEKGPGNASAHLQIHYSWAKWKKSFCSVVASWIFQSPWICPSSPFEKGEIEICRQKNWGVQSVFGYLWRGVQEVDRCVCWKGDEGKSGCKSVCALTWGVGDACSEFILSVCSLLLCISGRKLGCSTKSQEGLLDTRVINFFRVPVASVWILMLLTGLQLYRLSLKYEEALLEAPGVISWRVGANPSPSLLWLRHVKCALKIFIIILLPAHTHMHTCALSHTQVCTKTMHQGHKGINIKMYSCFGVRLISCGSFKPWSLRAD